MIDTNSVKYVGVDSTWLKDLPDWVKESGRTFEIVSDVRGWTPTEGTFKILIDFNEPDFYLKSTLEDITPVVDQFDLVLSRRPELIDLPNGEAFLMGPSWLSEGMRDNPTTDKDPSVSYTNTIKAFLRPRGEAPGYDIRRDINVHFEDLKDLCPIPIHFYNSKVTPINVPYECRWLEPDLNEEKTTRPKDKCFEHMYHVGIENCSLPNYVTERLIDCFAAMTVPVYYGMSNIGDYFDMEGVIQFNSLDEFIELLPTLTPERYESMIPAMKRNYEASKPFWTNQDRFWNAVKERMQDNE